MFIGEKCGNLKEIKDRGELTRNVSDASQYPVDVYSVKNVDESISSITMYNIVNQLGKHDFSSGSVVGNLKDSKLFLIK